MAINSATPLPSLNQYYVWDMLKFGQRYRVQYCVHSGPYFAAQAQLPQVGIVIAWHAGCNIIPQVAQAQLLYVHSAMQNL
ncbi:hypothetical protein L3X38_009878 [Prunus dulcis]|uniref:Uncharacterized protein n=1 Tax=Prunus dulcis TaxID=3755 RepID=A0AAD4WEH2_PRUDU|nr:hypothetical protein L3X38_009878 [Prunus dulcis]